MNPTSAIFSTASLNPRLGLVSATILHLCRRLSGVTWQSASTTPRAPSRYARSGQYGPAGGMYCPGLLNAAARATGPGGILNTNGIFTANGGSSWLPQGAAF